MSKLKVAVLMGGKSAEHEVSLISGKEVAKNLDRKKYEVSSLVIPKTGNFDIVKLVRIHPDMVFIALHGPYGEDGSIQGMLEVLRIPYTGAGVLVSALGMNKIMFRKVMERERIPVPNYLVFRKSDEQEKILDRFTFPLVVKPSCQGSSIGVSIVHKNAELRKALKLALSFDKEILVEEYLSGTEVTAGILGNSESMVLPLVEIKPKREFFDYQAKYGSSMCEENVPANISEELTKEVKETALRVYQAVSGEVFGRVDMIIVEGIPYVLEINTIPGLTPVSLFPKAAEAAGISYPLLLDKIIEFSLNKKND